MSLTRNRIDSLLDESMSTKDFVALADFIRGHNETEEDQFTDRQIKLLAHFCETQNPLFKWDRWMAYVNGTGGRRGGPAPAKVAQLKAQERDTIKRPRPLDGPGWTDPRSGEPGFEP
jgi:hypothetical protein